MTDNSSNDIILAAVEGNDLVRLKELLHSGADPNINRGKGEYSNPVIPLHVAVKKGYLEIIRCLLQLKADIEIVDGIGETALHFAACDGHADVLVLLISHDADVNKQSTEDGYTALHWACRIGHMTCVRILLEHGADADLRDVDEMTARDLAVKEKKSKVTKILDDFVGCEARVQTRLVAPLRPGPVCDATDELKSVKAELASLKAEMKQLRALKTEVGRLSALKTEVAQLLALKTEVVKLSTSKAEVAQLLTLSSEVEQLTTVRNKVNDLSSLVEELFPKEREPHPSLSIDVLLRSISQRQDVDDNWWSVGKELGFSRREITDFAIICDENEENWQSAIYKMLQTWCQNSNLNTDDQNMREIWRVLGKFGVSEEE